MKQNPSLAKVRNPRMGGALLALAALLFLAGVVLAAGTPAIDRWVIAGGGGHAEAPPLALSGTLGQTVVGVASTEGYALCSGFWCRPGGAAAAFSWAPLEQDEGFPVQFTDESTSYPDEIVAWSWDFGGLGTSTEQSPSFTFMDDGTYEVCLTVTYDDGSYSEPICHEVTILDLAPAAAFSWAPLEQDEGSPVQFTDESMSYPDEIVAWSWDFGGLGSSTEQNPSFTFMDGGTYNVCLTATDDDGSDSKPECSDVTILDLVPEHAIYVPLVLRDF